MFNLLKTKRNLFIQGTSPYRAVNTIHHNLMFFWQCIMNWLYISYQHNQHNLHEAYQLPCVQWIAPDDGHRRCPKHIGFYDKNKFWLLMHLVSCFYETYHDAWLAEHKVLQIKGETEIKFDLHPSKNI